MKSLKDRPPGTILEFPLPTGEYAYARVMLDLNLAFYRTRSRSSGHPPVGERDFEFIVTVHDVVILDRDIRVVGFDPAIEPSEDVPPPKMVRDFFTGSVSMLRGGEMVEVTEAEVEDLEMAAVWNRRHVIERLLGQRGRDGRLKD